MRLALQYERWKGLLFATVHTGTLKATHQFLCLPAAAAEAADVIICGDFNSEEQDSPYWLLRRGRLERNHTDACCPQVRAACFLQPQHLNMDLNTSHF